VNYSDCTTVWTSSIYSYDTTSTGYYAVSYTGFPTSTVNLWNITLEIPLDTIVDAVFADWSEIKREVEELLKSYGIPSEYADQAISMLKEKVREDLSLKGISDEWLVEALTKIYIRLFYQMLLAPPYAIMLTGTSTGLYWVTGISDP